MIAAALAALLSAAGRAQSPAPYMGSDDSASTTTAAGAPSSSTDTAVAASTATVSPTGHGAHVAGAQKAVLKRPIHAIIHKRSAHWTPVSLRVGGDPGAARSAATLAIHGRGRRRRGKSSAAQAFARARARGDETRLTISVFPRALRRRRKHFEIRLRVVEGFVEEAKAALVTVVDRRPGVGAGLDAEGLTREGVEFEEEFPGSGEILISALDARPSSKAFNAGRLRAAVFADRDAGLCEVSWSTHGLLRER